MSGRWWSCLIQFISNRWSWRCLLRCLVEIDSLACRWWYFRRPICPSFSQFQILMPSINCRSRSYWQCFLGLILIKLWVFLRPHKWFTWFWCHTAHCTNFLRWYWCLHFIRKPLPHKWYIFMRCLNSLRVTADKIPIIKIITGHSLLVQTTEVVNINRYIIRVQVNIQHRIILRRILTIRNGGITPTIWSCRQAIIHTLTLNNRIRNLIIQQLQNSLLISL